MTIIAVSHTHIAADGVKMQGEHITGYDAKKLEVRKIFQGDRCEQRIFAITGLFCMFEPAVDWILAGAKPADIPNCPGGHNGFEWWRVIEVSKDGIRGFGSDQPYPEHHSAPFAMGNGRDYALGAMWAGKTAKEAVELLCGRVSPIGGEIMELDIMQVTGFTLAQKMPKDDDTRLQFKFSKEIAA